jgi:hypothetical protein
MNLDLNTFKNTIKSIARPSLFYVEMGYAYGVNLSTDEMAFTCKVAQLPADDFTDIPVPFMGRVIHFNGNRSTNTSIQLTMFAASKNGETSWDIYKKFLAWHEEMNAQQANTARSIIMEDFKSDAKIYLMNADNSNSFLFTAVGCYPSSIGAVNLDWGSNNTADYTLTLQYDYIDFNNTGNTRVLAAI